MENPDYIDRSADSFAVQFVGGKQDIKTIPDVRGLAVWKSGHIGIYVGNGEVIEFRGVSYGCVKTKLSDPKRPWTHWGYIAGVDYADELTYPRQMVVATKQSSLNLRSAANIGDVIAKMPKNAPVWAMRESGGWCECVYYDGAAYHQGWASKEYLS